MMVGRRLEDFYEHTRHTPGKVVLEVRNMSDTQGDRDCRCRRADLRENIFNG